MDAVPSIESNVFNGSGNVFADLEFDDPVEEQAKAQLVLALGKIIKARELTQRQAGNIIGLTQPKLSHLLSGHWEGYTIDRLCRFMTLLGRNVRIVIEPAGAAGDSSGKLTAAMQ